MESMEPSCTVPPGFRFHPTDEELVGYYLRKKVASQKIDLDVIREIDLYRIEPWDLQDTCRIGYEEQKDWYFFSHKDKKYPTGTRTNRATMAGFWKATGRDKAVYDKSKLIGMRKTLVFYKGRAPNGQKTDWIMHEYRLESDENGPPQEEGWVVCRAFKKRATNGQNKSIDQQGWIDTSYFYDEQPSNNVTTMVHDPCMISRQSHENILVAAQNMMIMCKQESEGGTMENINLIHSSDDPFVQLPQLESPSLPLMKRPSSTSGSLPDMINDSSNERNKKRKVTDWRDLDKFVASQLMSQEEERILLDGVIADDDDQAILSFAASENNSRTNSSSSSDLAALLLLQGGRDQEMDKLNAFLCSSSMHI